VAKQRLQSLDETILFFQKHSAKVTKEKQAGTATPKEETEDFAKHVVPVAAAQPTNESNVEMAQASIGAAYTTQPHHVTGTVATHSTTGPAFTHPLNASSANIVPTYTAEHRHLNEPMATNSTNTTNTTY